MKYFALPILVIFFLSCESPQETWEKDYSSFKAHFDTTGAQAYRDLMQLKAEVEERTLDSLFIEEVIANSAKRFKDVEMDLGKDSWNTLFLLYSDLEALDGKVDTLKGYNIYLDFYHYSESLRRFANDQEMEIGWLKSLKDANGDIGDEGAMIAQYDRFKRFVDQLHNADYYLISYPMLFIQPEKDEYELTFVTGEYVALLFLYDAKSNELIDAFSMYTINSEEVSSNLGTVKLRDLNHDLIWNIKYNLRDSIMNRYSPGNFSDLEGVSFYRYLDV